MKHNIEYTHKNIKLLPISQKDIEQLRHWRNDGNLTKYLSKIDYITKEKQSIWYQKDLENKDCYSFAIHETNELNGIIGSVALYHFDKKCVEFGRLIIGNTHARRRGYGYLATALCLQVAFEEFNVDEVVAYVYEENISALSSYKKAGFRVLKKDERNELEIKITKKEFLSLKENTWTQHNT